MTGESEYGLSGDVSLQDARRWLKERVYDGVRCPCCHQFAKVYRRSINAGMARSLVRMYRYDPVGFQYIPTTVGGRSREEGKLRYWGLVEEELIVREDGGRAGWWRVTPLGAEWVREEVRVPKYVNVYDGAQVGQLYGPSITIRDALGTKFDLHALLTL